VLFPVFDDNAFNEGVAFHPDLLGAVELSDGFGASIVDFADGVSDEDGIEAVRAAVPESLSIYSFPSRPGDVANLAQVSSMPFALAGFLVVVALGAITHALVTSVRRRRRDLGVVRAIGFLRREVVTSIAIQSSTLVAVGLLVGVPLGVALGRSAWSLVADGLGVAPSPTVPAVALGAVIVGGLAAAATVALWPAHRAAATAPAESLRAE
jgi:ABC-type antimicrobial peptide transport system permease subunit